MAFSLVNMFSSMLAPSYKVNRKSVARPTVASSNNPFANPFMSPSSVNASSYGKNTPVQGGYFAGYYNGQPNIVGKQLFIEA